MDEQIKVTIFLPARRKAYQMRYRHPDTGRYVMRSCKTTVRRDAERKAAKWEAELRSGQYKSPLKTTWADFRLRYEAEVLTGLAERTDQKVGGVLNAIERILNPSKLRELTADRLSYFQSVFREEQVTVPAKKSGGKPTEQVIRRSPDTIKGALSHLMAALKWAKTVGMLREVPQVQTPKRAKGSKSMKGRPITLEEFERMLAKVPDVVWKEPRPAKGKRPKPVTAADETRKAAVVASWTHYLRGLWLSGLRLSESLELYWDRDDKLCVDLSGKRPMLRIRAELEKGNKDRLLPMAPEFAEFLMETPKAKRHGCVFKFTAQRSAGDRLSVGRTGRIVVELGAAAGVKVSTDVATGAVKYASAHDLRRSFGARWASRVMPQVLKELMRHEAIETTMRFYVGRNAQSTADVLWQAHQAAGGSATLDLGGAFGGAASSEPQTAAGQSA